MARRLLHTLRTLFGRGTGFAAAPEMADAEEMLLALTARVARDASGLSAPASEALLRLKGRERTAALAAWFCQVEDMLAARAPDPLAFRVEFRGAAVARWPRLAALDEMAIAFSPPAQLEVTLCRVFLGEAVQKAREILGAASGSRLADMEHWLAAGLDRAAASPFTAGGSDADAAATPVAAAIAGSHGFFTWLDRSLGRRAEMIYEAAYQRTARQFGAADSFPIVLGLMPERMITAEKLGLLRRGQIEQVLREKIVQLERANDDIARAKEEADAANAAKSEFLSNMSHELRTPLNSILGFAQLLTMNGKEPLTVRQERQIGQIVRSGKHLLALIEDVLDLSKIETGNVRLSLERVRLQPVLEQVRAELQILAGEAGIALEVGYPDSLPDVRADQVRLVQVLMNLGSNAIKYNRAGGNVVVAVDAAGSGHVRISVADTGPGIAPERLAELFQPFNRLGAETGPIQGSGIGLSIAKKLVELMAGSIQVESVLGAGSTFIVELPAMAEAQAAGERGSALARLPGLRPGFSMLYVEDNPSNIRLMEELVETLGNVRLVTAADARSGLDLARARRPDLIVLDINLPGMNGLEMLAQLKAQPANAATPVMALSAAATRRQVEDGLAAGFARYLTKPLDVPLFLRSVAEVLPGP